MKEKSNQLSDIQIVRAVAIIAVVQIHHSGNKP
jgi:hypothetical protein